MDIRLYEANGYQVIRVHDDLGPRADLAEVRSHIEHLIASGSVRIALAFTSRSYLDSRAIGNLATCVELIRSHHGALAVIQPNASIADFLRLVGFTRTCRYSQQKQNLACRRQPGASD